MNFNAIRKKERFMCPKHLAYHLEVLFTTSLKLETQSYRSSFFSKGQKKWKWFFQDDVSSKKRTNESYFTTMKPQVDLFSFVFWKKLKTPKRHFEINWPLKVSQSRNYFFKPMFLQKNEQTNSTSLLRNLRSTCFRSFFGRNWRQQKDISKSTELYKNLVI